jgi:capsule biosynthesis phosphatase
VRARGTAIVVRCISALEATPLDIIVLAYHRSLEAHNFRDLIKREFPKLQVRFVPLRFQTRGAAETVLLGLAALSGEELERPTLVADGDSVFTENVLDPMRDTASNLIYFCEDTDSNPIYSYLLLGDDMSVNDIREKEKVSDHACIGAYGFETGECLYKYCRITIDAGRQNDNELYMSDVYRMMLKDGCHIEGHRVDRWECLGTPVQLRTWAENDETREEPLRVCFDLDNTLVTYPSTPGDYETCLPIPANVRFLRFLKESGHTIIIHTARRMRTHAGNITAVIDDIGDLTLRQLKQFEIPYDEIVFGKPYADLYVDDLGVLPQIGLEQQTGFYMASVHAPRPWHKITLKDRTVRKSGRKHEIDAEAAWYRGLPSNLASFAPRLIGAGNGVIEIERVPGIPMSQLHVSGTLQSEDLSALLAILDQFHAHPGNSQVNIYGNYGEKLRIRDRQFDAVHLPDYACTRRQLIDWLENYKARDCGQLGLVHGDPVFTNVIVTPTHEIKLIDPRGRVGDVQTMSGDIFYDYAKVYQSLLGYDAILQEVPHPENSKLVQHFQQYVLARYDVETLRNVTMIAASLIFSLICLHSRPLHGEFLTLANSAMALAGRR